MKKQLILFSLGLLISLPIKGMNEGRSDKQSANISNFEEVQNFHRPSWFD